MIRPIIREAAKHIKQANYIVITTGAGMGVDSGLPDYRGDKGFWNSFPPFSNKFTFIECASPHFLKKHPNLFWGFYGTRLNLYRNTKPHYGYKILQDIIKKKKDHFAVTSNVDGHLTKFFGYNTYEVHGSIHLNQCSNCIALNYNQKFTPIINEQQMSCSNVPKCSMCQAVMRPNILMFGDSNWDPHFSDIQEQKFNKFVNKYKQEKITIIQIGAGESIPTIRRIGQSILNKGQRNRLIRINPQQQDQVYKKIINIGSGALSTLQQINKAINSYFL